MSIEDFYCLKVVRYGALGIEEERFHQHAIPASLARTLVTGHLITLGPGDKVEITLTRGAQPDSPLAEP